MKRKCVVSIHDVMPHTLPQVQHCLNQCAQHGIESVYLLVVPGLAWQEDQIEQLHLWSGSGHQIVGHGWLHRCRSIKRIYHRLHSVMISRDVAEHLALDAEEIVELMIRCRVWFSSVSLPTPRFYVPPAWALGQISEQQLKQTGFDYIESNRGIYHVGLNQWKTCGLLGYEADTHWRAMAIKAWNGGNRGITPLDTIMRLSIHPYDFGLKLSADLHSDLSRCTPVSLESIFELTKYSAA